MAKPFRWNIARCEQSGRLVDGPPTSSYPEVVEDIYLSGVVAATSWGSRLTLLNISLSRQSLKELRRDYPERLRYVCDHLSELELNPEALVRRRPVAFVDLVNAGSTFRHLAELICGWGRETRVDDSVLVRKIRFVGITCRTKTSPNTVRWHQQADWLADFPSDAAKNVSIPGRLWDYLGNRQGKAEPSNPPWRWGDESTLSPPRQDEHIEASRTRELDLDTHRHARDARRLRAHSDR